ncbi:MAG TPA: hypothetical protein DEB44_05545, partial [Acidimicrobiaceae bacterium]|nr:hypothetical protein [Acidimicrobiaceae bacterium]
AEDLSFRSLDSDVDVPPPHAADTNSSEIKSDEPKVLRAFRPRFRGERIFFKMPTARESLAFPNLSNQSTKFKIEKAPANMTPDSSFSSSGSTSSHYGKTRGQSFSLTDVNQLDRDN